MTEASRDLRRWSLLGWLALAATTAACASSGAVPHPFPMPGGSTPGPTVLATAPTVVDTAAVAVTALSLRGCPYRNGGSAPEGFDCSGFVQYVFGQHGTALPREVRELYEMGRRVKLDQVTPGDLLFFHTVSHGASHVGIALGGDAFIHAPSSTGVVRVERLSAQYWSRRFVGARRIN